MFSLVCKTKLKSSIAVGVSSVKESVQPCYSASYIIYKARGWKMTATGSIKKSQFLREIRALCSGLVMWPQNFYCIGDQCQGWPPKETLEPKIRISGEFNTYILKSILKQLFKCHLTPASSIACLSVLRTNLIITHQRIFVLNSFKIHQGYRKPLF